MNEREAAQLAVALPNPYSRDAGDPGPQTRRLAGDVQSRMRSRLPEPDGLCARHQNRQPVTWLKVRHLGAGWGLGKPPQGDWRLPLIPRISPPQSLRGCRLHRPPRTEKIFDDQALAAAYQGGQDPLSGQAPHLEQVRWQFRAVKCRP